MIDDRHLRLTDTVSWLTPSLYYTCIQEVVQVNKYSTEQMEDTTPPSPRRRSLSPQRGVLTPSMNLEDEYEYYEREEQQMQHGEYTMMSLLEKQKPAAMIKKTACRETRSLPCSPQHRLVDERHRWIEEKLLLSFDEQDKTSLAQPSLLLEAGKGKGELVENRHKWIQQEILDKKTMQHASPRFDEGKYGPIRVADGSPPSSPKNNESDEYGGIVEVVSSVDDDEPEPAAERTCNTTIESTPEKAAAQTSEALESVRESVSQQQQEADASSVQGGAAESKSAGAVSLSDTISMDDFNVSRADSQSVTLDTGILPWDAVVEQQRSMDAIALEKTAATDGVLPTKAHFSAEEKKIDNSLVVVKPESGKDENASFLGDIETPHRSSTQLETKSVKEPAGEKGTKDATVETNNKGSKVDVKVLETELLSGENLDRNGTSSDDETPKKLDLVAANDASVQMDPSAITKALDEDPPGGQASPAVTADTAVKKKPKTIAVSTSSPEPTETAIQEAAAESDVGVSTAVAVACEEEEAGTTLAEIADSASTQLPGVNDTLAPANLSEEQSNKVEELFDSDPDDAETFAQRSPEVFIEIESVKQFAEEEAGPDSAKPMSDESIDALVPVEQEACSESNVFACGTVTTEPACAPTSKDAAVVVDKQQASTKAPDIGDMLEASKEVAETAALFDAPTYGNNDGRTTAVEAPTDPEQHRKEVQWRVSTAECLKQMGSTAENPSLSDVNTTPKASAVPLSQDQHTTPVESNTIGIEDADTAAGGISGQNRMNNNCAGANEKSELVATMEKEPEKMEGVGQRSSAVDANPEEAAVAGSPSLEVQTAAAKCLEALALADEPVKKSQMNRWVSFEFEDIVLSDETADKAVARVGKGSSPAWEAVTDYLTCNSPCHNQAPKSSSFEAKFKPDSAESTSTKDGASDNRAKNALVSGRNLAPATQSENAPVAPVEHQVMPSLLDNGAGSMAGISELATEEEVATKEPDTIVINDEPFVSVEVVASPNPMPGADESALFDDKDSAENAHDCHSSQVTTFAEQSSAIDYGYLSQSVAVHARRNKERLEKAKELLLHDVPVPADKPSVDPEIEYKKRRLMEAKKLLLELADVKSSVVRRLAVPHEPSNSSSNEEKEQAKEQTEPCNSFSNEETEKTKEQTGSIATGTHESINEEKKITGESFSTEVVEPVSAQCTDQCIIS